MYQNLIVELTGCTTAESVGVEAFMRCEFGTLDGINRPKFRQVARQCLRIVQENPVEAVELAKSFGLVR